MSKITAMKNILWCCAAILCASSMIAHAQPAEKRCGWLSNPTPGNYLLTDRDMTWTVSAQGGFSAQGMDNLPDFNTREYKKTNGNYGYGCACLRVTVDTANQRIVSILDGQMLPLKTCQNDKSLQRVAR